jgi:FkbM family methyltransferase
MLVGRRNLYRISRFLMYTARGDVANTPYNPLLNGESMVQMVALGVAASPVTIFDVGANIGEWTSGLLEISCNLRIPAEVYAFEPCRDTFAQLSGRYGNRTNVTLINEACSRQVGTATMHVYGSGAGTNSLAEPVDDNEALSENVRLTTIDYYCNANGIGTIDLLKIDAEGVDYDVIVGASSMLDKKSIRILQFEYNQRWIGSRNYLRDAFNFLVPRGYVIGKLMGPWVEFYPHWRWELEHYAEGNYIACLRDDMDLFQHCEPIWLWP